MFTRSLTEWTLQQKLKHSDPKKWDVFGNSIAISGETIITGTGGSSMAICLKKKTSF